MDAQDSVFSAYREFLTVIAGSPRAARSRDGCLSKASGAGVRGVLWATGMLEPDFVNSMFGFSGVYSIQYWYIQQRWRFKLNYDGSRLSDLKSSTHLSRKWVNMEISRKKMDWIIRVPWKDEDPPARKGRNGPVIACKYVSGRPLLRLFSSLTSLDDIGWWPETTYNEYIYIYIDQY